MYFVKYDVKKIKNQINFFENWFYNIIRENLNFNILIYDQKIDFNINNFFVELNDFIDNLFIIMFQKLKINNI